MLQLPWNTVLLESEASGFKVVRLPCFIQVWGELCLDRDAKLSDCVRLRSNKKIGPFDWSVRMTSSLGWSSNLLDLAGERAQSVTENGNYTVCVSVKSSLVATQRMIIFPKEKIGPTDCSPRIAVPNSLIRNALDFSGECAQSVTPNRTGSCNWLDRISKRPGLNLSVRQSLLVLSNNSKT